MKQWNWKTGLAGFGLAAIALAGAAGCRAPADYQPFAVSDQACLLLQVEQGETLRFPLVENPTTGYSWQAAIDNPAVLAETGSEFVPPGTELAGAPGNRIFVFTALKRGSVTVTFTYQRPWEKDTPAQSFKLMILVE